MPLLELRNVGLRFGGIVALDDVSMDVEGGQIVGLIGPNGAGKTTAFNVITRLYEPDRGSVTIDGVSLLKARTHNVIRHGIARTFQNNELFPTMTVLDTVLVGTHSTSRFRRESANRAAAMEALELVGIERVAGRYVAALPFGTRKQVELARALASRPRLLLLDEPAGGLNHEEVTILGAFIKRLRDERDLTVLLVEHHMNLVMSVSDHVHVLNFGRMLAGGTPHEVQRNPKVIEAYLGGEVAADAPTPRGRPGVTALLELEDVDARYGDLQVLRNVSLTVDEGQIVAVLGANGAGKTTVLRAISNSLVKRRGTILFAGRPLTGRPEAVARRGIAHVPDGRGTFVEFTVWENLRLGAFSRRDAGKDDFRRVLDYFPWIDERRNQEAGTLSGGEQQMLALARAFMARPKLMLLDEPSLGLAPLITADIFRIIKELNENEGVTVLVVEQNANIALQLADRAYVLEVGQIAMSGTGDELRGNEQVRRSYLGY